MLSSREWMTLVGFILLEFLLCEFKCLQRGIIYFTFLWKGYWIAPVLPLNSKLSVVLIFMALELWERSRLYYQGRTTNLSAFKLSFRHIVSGTFFPHFYLCVILSCSSTWPLQVVHAALYCRKELAHFTTNVVCTCEWSWGSSLQGMGIDEEAFIWDTVVDFDACLRKQY